MTAAAADGRDQLAQDLTAAWAVRLQDIAEMDQGAGRELLEPIGRPARQPPPPLDPELEAALAASGERMLSTGITADSLERARAMLLASVPSLEQLAARGVFDVEGSAAPRCER
ncbi:hypothetical protein ACIBJF_40025 [Streptomyces sp. NPDC050743]|uniref:hypothetical protein n=1 Tax=Streptomyces sp. NPDC050743 TaxID=3365634 RepID=UPI0037A55756